MTSSSMTQLVGKTVTCYGRGATLYGSPTGAVAPGPWRQLTRTIVGLDASDNTLVIESNNVGYEIIAHGDSGGPCLLNGVTVGVNSRVEMQCPDPNNCNVSTVTKYKKGFLRYTGEFKNYIDSAKLRPDPGIAAWARLDLKNGWSPHPYSTNMPEYAWSSSAVHFRGAISSTQSNMVAFTLSPIEKPVADIYVPVTLCSGNKGRLFISKNTGDVTIQTEGGDPFYAKCMTSLDGASYYNSVVAPPALALSGGWTTNPYNTRTAGVYETGGIVRLVGAIANGTTTTPFTLGSGLRPTAKTYVGADLCNATKGRLAITSGGSVTIEHFGAFSDANCFTSLDGISFHANISGFTTPTLLNGWTNTISGRAPAAKNIGGIVRFQGSMVTSGTSGVAFQLPPEMRPAVDVYIPVDIGNSAAKGSLHISRWDGVVTVQTPSGLWSHAQYRTSLEGAWFGL